MFHNPRGDYERTGFQITDATMLHCFWNDDTLNTPTLNTPTLNTLITFNI